MAFEKNGGIGMNLSIPWSAYFPEDLKFFSETTTNNIVIMGRLTYESLPERYRPLPNRVNIVVSKAEQAEFPPTVTKVQSLKGALQKAHQVVETSSSEGGQRMKVFIVGGVQMYNEAHNEYHYLCDGIYATQIEKEYECDRHIDISFISKCTSTSIEPQTTNQKGITYERNLYQFTGKWALPPEYPYIKLLQKIYKKGKKRDDRTGVGTVSKFGVTMKFDISKSIPIFTTKKVLYDKVIGELLWFVSGSTSVHDLQKKNIRFWDANSSREFLDKRGLSHYEEGDLGPVYGFQWRHWGATYEGCNADYTNKGVDQLAEVISTLKNDPNSRRIIISAWNVNMINQMALPPCHTLCQFYVRDGTFLDCQLYQRSGDMFLGIPFNVTSYSVLVYMIAEVTGLKPGKFIHVIGDAHIYLNHLDSVAEQLARTPLPFPTLSFKREIKSIEDFTDDDFVVKNYQFWPFIRAEMAV